MSHHQIIAVGYFIIGTWMCVRLNGQCKRIKAIHAEAHEVLGEIHKNALDKGVWTKSMVSRQAMIEFNQDKFRRQVEIAKNKLKNKKKFWHKIMPFKIVRR